MIFPTSGYLYRIWHDMAKRTFFTRVHVEWKVATFNWSNHPAAMGNCVQYMQHTFHPFLIRPFLFYRTELCSSTTLHTPNIFQWVKKRCECGVSTPVIPREREREREGEREREMESEIKCELCSSSSNWYSDFYSEIYSCRPFPEFFPFHRHCPIDKASDTHRHGAVIVQREGRGKDLARKLTICSNCLDSDAPSSFSFVLYSRSVTYCAKKKIHGISSAIWTWHLSTSICAYTYKIRIHTCRIHVKFYKRFQQDCTAERRKLNRLETIHNHIIFSCF